MNQSLIKSYPIRFIKSSDFHSLEKMFLLHELLNKTIIQNYVSKNSYIIPANECLKNGFLNMDNFYMYKYLIQNFEKNKVKLLYILLYAEKSINFYSTKELGYEYKTLRFLRDKYVLEKVVCDKYNTFFKNSISDVFKYHNIMFTASNFEVLKMLKYYIELDTQKKDVF